MEIKLMDTLKQDTCWQSLVLTNVTRHDNCFTLIKFCLPWILVYRIPYFFLLPTNLRLSPDVFSFFLFSILLILCFLPHHLENNLCQIPFSPSLKNINKNFCLTLVSFLKLLTFKTINPQTSLFFFGLVLSSLWDLCSSTRVGTWALGRERGVLTTGQPGNFSKHLC